MRFFSDEWVIMRAKAPGREAPLEQYSVRTKGWVEAGVKVGDIEFLQPLTPEEASMRLQAKGASATEANKAVHG